MEVARTSLCHVGAPQFPWPQAVRYAVHQLNLWPRDARPRMTSVSFWTGSPGVAADYRFYNPVTCQFFTSQDVTFDESVSYYRSRPHRGFEAFSPLLFLTLEPPPIAPVAPPPSRPAPSGVSHDTLQSSPPQRPVPVVSGGAGGAVAEGEGTGAAGARGANFGGAGGVRLEATPEEDTAVSTQRPRPTSPPGFPSVSQFPPRSPPRPVAACLGVFLPEALESLGVLSVEVLVLGHFDRLEREERERFERAQQQQQQQSQSEPAAAPPPPPPAPAAAPAAAAAPPPPPPPVSVGARAVSPEPHRSCYHADDPFHLVLCSRVPPPLVLPQPPESSLTVFHDPLSDYLRASCPVVSRVLSALVTHPTAPPLFVSALVTTVSAFASSHRLDSATHLVSGTARSLSSRGAPIYPLEVLEDRQFEHGFLAAAVPHLCAMLLAPEGDPDTLDIPIPRTHAEAVSGPWASYSIAAEEAKMASYRSTGTYGDAVPPPGANVVSGMWLYKVKRPPGAPLVFKAHYVARGFCQREGVDFFQTFAPTPKMTTLRVLLHIAAQRDYELHSLDFSTVFLQGSLHEQIWLRRPPGFTGSFPPGTQWQLRRLIYGMRQAPREWHGMLSTTLAALDFFPSSADPSMFVRCGSTPFFFLVYVDDLRYLGLQITRDRAARTITLTHSHMVEQILTRFHFPFSKVQPTPLAVDHGLTAPPSDKPFESIGPYPELVGCLMYLMTCTCPDLAYPLSILARFVAPGRHRPSHWYAAKRVAKYVASTSCMGLVLGGKQPVTLTGFSDSSWADNAESLRSTQGYCFSLETGAVSWRSTRASSVSSSSCEAEVYAAAMASEELRWLSFLLTDLGEWPRSPPVLFADNMSAILLCEEPRLSLVRSHGPTSARPVRCSIAARWFARFRVSYASRLVAAHPLSVRCPLPSPSLYAMLLSLEGDPEALDISTPRTYREAVSGEWASQWKAAMDAELASWRSTGTYVDAVPPPRASVVDGMWLFKVKRPPGSPPMFKARYLARDFSQREGVYFFLTFAPTPKMTTLRVLLHVAAQRDYELHSLDFSTAFLQGRLHEEIWLRRPPGFTDTFPPRTHAEAEIYVGAMEAQELRWLTFLLADLGVRPRSAPTLYADNKAMILLCREPRLESRVKHIDVRYFLLRELQQRGQARVDFVASEAGLSLSG
ncbi:unnamed protein product [Closterium sp. NIES-54]